MRSDRRKLNLVVDALMMLCLMAMAGLGFLMKYVLPPGPERRLKYGTSANLFLFGNDRHQWGQVHLLIGFVLLGLLVLHIVLHWAQIGAFYRAMFAGRAARWVIALAFAAVCLFLIAFPLLVAPEVREAGGARHRRGRADAAAFDAGPLTVLAGGLPASCAGCEACEGPTGAAEAAVGP